MPTKLRVGQPGQDICPEHSVRESLVMVAHSHYRETCYRVFKTGCGHVYVIDQSLLHCSDGDTHEEVMEHALGHITACASSVLCSDCRILGESAMADRNRDEWVCEWTKRNGGLGRVPIVDTSCGQVWAIKTYSNCPYCGKAISHKSRQTDNGHGGGDL